MRFNLVVALQTVSVLALTAVAFSPIYVPDDDQRPFFDTDEGASFFDLSDTPKGPARYASPFSDTGKHNTIYEALKSDERFTRITKAIKFVDGIDDLLDDAGAELTFFAPPDNALRRPHHNDTESTLLSIENLAQSSFDLPQALSLLEDLEPSSDDDKPDKNHCKKILKIIIRALLEYHIIPTGAWDQHHLRKNQTFSSNLVIPGTLDGSSQRIRVQSKVIPPATIVNFYSRIIYGDWKASNGFIHVIDHPLIPPPSAFEGLYMFPHFFSTFTSTLQRSNLTDEVDLRYIHGSGWRGSDSITVFAPMNQAFDRLPHKLRLYLFSPWGSKALRKLLEYHIAPEAIVFSDYVHFEDDDGDDKGDRDCPCGASLTTSHDGQQMKTLPKVSFASFGRLLRRPPKWSIQDALSSREVVTNTTYNLETLFSNHTVRAQIVKNKITYPFPGPKKPSRYDTKVFVNGRHVLLADVPARNGVVHVVQRVLNPHCKDRHHHHDHDHSPPHEPHHPPHPPHEPHHPHHPHEPHDPHDGDFNNDACWEDWETWLPQWAETK